MRLDQWLWAVRVFKTRSISADAIKNGRVQVNGAAMKPAHEVRAGELIAVRMDHGAVAWTRTLRVIGAPPSRVGAKLVAQFAEDLTTAEELAKRDIREPSLLPPGFRAPGMGRPTKRERREMDDFGAAQDSNG